MKKLYILFLFLTPFFVNAQTFSFNTDGDQEGWTKSNSSTETVSGGNYTLTPSGNTPKLIYDTPGSIDGTAVNFVSITLQNNTSNTLLRFSHPKSNPTKTMYTETFMAPKDPTFHTYTFNLTDNDGWGIAGIAPIQFLFRAGFNANAIQDGTIVIDEIKFFTGTTTLKESYTFDGVTSENWIHATGYISDVSSGILTLRPTVDKWTKIIQNVHHVDATTNKYIHVTLKNHSTLNNNLRLNFADQTINLAIDTKPVSSDAVEKTYTYDLSGVAEWTGNQTIQFIIGDSGNSGKASDAEILEVNSIIVDNVLAVDEVDYKDDASITLYPNPVQNVLKINAPNAVNKIEVFNILGQKVLSNKNSNTLNVQGLSKGAYITKIYQDNDTISTKRFFKD